jgi:hypothetical protein
LRPEVARIVGSMFATQLVIIVTPATSVSFFRPEFDDFLYAPIGEDEGQMPLSVLSALARLDVDPWQEAAELSELPKGTATQRLASLIARLPDGRRTLADWRAIADRLIELLPRRGTAEVPLTETRHGLREMTGSTAARLLICAAFAATVFFIAAMSERSSRSNHVVDVPPSNTVSPPQTLP